MMSHPEAELREIARHWLSLMRRALFVAGAAAALLGASCVGTHPDDAALAAKVNRELFLKGKNTPAEYATDKIGSHPTFVSKRILGGELTSGKDGTREGARAAMNELLADIDKGFNWPVKVPPQFDLPHATAKPVIDGELGDGAWKDALTFTGEYPLSSMEKSEYAIVWKLMWDEDYLYAGAVIPDASIVSVDFDEVNKKYPWDADVLELFVMPERRPKSYWEVVVNPGNKIVDGLHTYNLVAWPNGLAEDMRGLVTKTKLSPDSYTVEAALPFKEMPGYTRGNQPKVGESLYLVMVRINDGRRMAFIPLLYDGHNIFGYPQFTLK